jgi:hypothetical protein
MAVSVHSNPNQWRLGTWAADGSSVVVYDPINNQHAWSNSIGITVTPPATPPATTPTDYTGKKGQQQRVNAAETALEFFVNGGAIRGTATTFAALPTANAVANDLAYLSAVDGTNQPGFYSYNGANYVFGFGVSSQAMRTGTVGNSGWQLIENTYNFTAQGDWQQAMIFDETNNRTYMVMYSVANSFNNSPMMIAEM